VTESDYKQLRAYQLARALRRDVRASVRHWQSLDQWSTGLQLLRAADSIGANIAEANGRWHLPDQIRHLYIARGSLYEVEHLISVAEEDGLLPAGTHGRIPELARTLDGLIRRRKRGL
jgi:four helix bundle protein